MANTPFHKVAEGAPAKAAILARAFMHSHDIDQVYAILRFARALVQWSDLAGYLMGCYFAEWQDDDGFTDSSFEDLQAMAWDFFEDPDTYTAIVA